MERGALTRLASAVADWVAAAKDQALAALPSRRTLGPDEDGPCADAAIPVVLLPGILENPRYLMPLARHLASLGHPVHVVRSLGWNLAELAASVDRAFADLERDDVRGAVVVAHSKGGLIGKAMLLDPRAEGRLAGMVAVATPFNGSRLWHAAQRTALVRRSPLGLFDPDHPDLSALASERGVNARIVSLAPRFDQMVRGGSRLDGAVNREVPVSGHFRAVTDPAAWAVVHEELHRLSGTELTTPSGT